MLGIFDHYHNADFALVELREDSRLEHFSAFIIRVSNGPLPAVHDQDRSLFRVPPTPRAQSGCALDPFYTTTQPRRNMPLGQLLPQTRIILHQLEMSGMKTHRHTHNRGDSVSGESGD